MNENLQFLQALKDVSDEDFNEDMNSISLTGEHEFSDKFNRKMKKLIARQKKQYFRFVSTAGRRAACIILAVVVISASALSVEAVRHTVFDFIMKIFSGHSVVITESGTDSDYPTSIKENYYISRLPDGFKQTQYGKTDKSFSEYYAYNDSYILFKQIIKADYETYFDNEQTDYVKVEDGGQDYFLFESDNDVTYIWDNGSYIFEITSNLDKETVLNLCKSTKLHE